MAYEKIKNTVKNAVIYARYSSDNQREESIEGQVRECSAMAARMGLNVIEIYADRAISGKTDDRREFQRMIADSSRRQFQFVIVYKTDRFARNKSDSAIYKTLLKKNGVKVLYSNENIPDSPEGIVLESVLEGFAEYFSANLAVNVRRGMKDNALKGRPAGARAPYGFTLVDGSLVVNPATAPAVKMIFEKYAAGASIPSICEALKNAGYKTNSGDDFAASSLRTILTNEKYKGTLVYNADIEKNDIIRIEGAIPAIVSADLFDLVQKLRGEKKQKPRLDRGRYSYMLAGRVRCCGGGSYVGNSKGAGSLYYRCETRHNRFSCSCGHYYIKADKIDAPVFDFVSRVLLNPENIAAISERAASIQSPAASNVAPMEARLADVETGIKNIIAAVERGLFSASMQDRLADLENEKTALQKNIAMEKLHEAAPLSADNIGDFLRSFLAGDFSDPEYKKALLQALVHSVVIYPDRAEVSFCADGVPLLAQSFPL